LAALLLVACSSGAPGEPTPDPEPVAVDPTAGATLVTDPAAAPSDRGAIWLVSVVSQRPVLRAPMRLVYPDSLRRLGLSGSVTLEFVLDTLGRAEPNIRIVQAAHPALVAPAKAMILSARYRPARVRGRPVRVLLAMRVRVGAGETR
jgi:outer membrane biosynthesis protein TonB